MTSDQPQSPSIPVQTTGGGSVAEAFIGAFRNKGFTACLLLLAGLSLTYQYFFDATGVIPKKLPAPLRKPLNQLDPTKLAPYEVLQAWDIKSEQLDALGTREYVQWEMQDTSVSDRADPARLVSLFVTYYTDTPGQVPHVPEECFLGSGHSLSSEEIIEVPIPDLQQSISVKMLTFEGSAFLGRQNRTVMYTFHSNGRFAPDRQVVRTIINSPRDQHAYFSKLEISFGNGEVVPSREKTIAAGKRFLAKVVPVLVREHWPDWASLERPNTVRNAATENRPGPS
jgi:hypothetical protein